MSFIDDIQGQNTQLFPIVTIEPPDMTSWAADFHRGVLISTNSVSLEHIHIDDDTLDTPFATGRNHYFKPLLLNIPSIKESIDIESRRFKISNVNLDISNYEYEGKRFTDMLSDTSLINWKCSIQFASPSANYFSTIYGVNTWGGVSFYEAYTGNHNGFSNIPAGQVYDPNNRSGSLTQMVYQGIIRRISHDDEKVRIELEDLTEQKAHKDLPSEFLGNGDDVPDKYKNKPIPMVYGHVDRSPVVISDNFSKYQVDSRDILGFVNKDSGYTNSSDDEDNSIYLDSLQVDIDGEVHHIKQEGQYEEGGNSINLLSSVLSGIVSGGDNTADTFSEVSLICRKITNQKFNISNIKHDPDLLNQDFLTADGGTIDNINAITDGSLNTNYLKLEGLRPNDSFIENENSVLSGSERLLLSLNFDVTPSHDTINGNAMIGFKINGYNLPKYLGNKILKVNHIGGLVGLAGDLTGVSGDYDSHYHLIWDENQIVHEKPPHYDEINSVFGFTEFIVVDSQMPSTYYDTAADADIRLRWFVGEEDNIEGSSQGMRMPVLLFSGGFINWFAIQFRIVGTISYPTGEARQRPHVEVEGNINEIGLLVENQSLKLFNNDFYANVKGRTAPGFSALLQNPIDIIGDLVVNELGHDAIDLDDYTEARGAHDDWKFGFTVNKKINSKKLIEEIAKSTRCFPYFKNDGTFGFNTIKDSYTAPDIEAPDGNSDYEKATLIKESEVISYSFKKTKPEQVYKKVTVSYNKGYAEDSYLKTTDPELYDLGADPYYGIKDSSDAYLEFESDYIRDKDTADALAKFLSYQYRNDHLTFNLKLPLQYINLEIGNLVKFRELFSGVKAYGIDYRVIQNMTYTDEDYSGQYYYPLFMVTSTQKNLDSVSIECMQLHYLNLAYFPQSSGWFEMGEGKTFYFSDSDVVVFGEQNIDLIPPVISGFLENINIETDESSIEVSTDSAEAWDGDVEITDLIEVTASANGMQLDNWMGGDEHSLGIIEADTQILVQYNVESPTTGLSASPVQITINVAVDTPPEITIDTANTNAIIDTENIPTDILFNHTISLDDLDGELYFDKYMHDLQDTDEEYLNVSIGYKAEDEEDGNLVPAFVPDVEYLPLVIIYEEQNVGYGLGYIQNHIVTDDYDFFSLAESHFEVTDDNFTKDVALWVADSVGHYHYIKWRVTITPSEAIYIPAAGSGDVNSDGVVNVVDLLGIVSSIIGTTTFTEEQLIIADGNGDGTVNVSDIVHHIQTILGN